LRRSAPTGWINDGNEAAHRETGDLVGDLLRMGFSSDSVRVSLPRGKLFEQAADLPHFRGTVSTGKATKG
jgi:hypothetical protein